MANERKNQIIKAAVKRFARHGLNKTTLDEIARDIRIGKATIYHYFTSKDDLYIESLKWEMDLFLEQSKSVFADESKKIGEKLLEYFSIKDTIPENYKLIYETLLNYYTDKTLEIENELIKWMWNKEEEVIKKILSITYHQKVVSISPALPNFIVMCSWGILFGNRLNIFTNPNRAKSTQILLLKSIESVLN
jgi:AcrR family transcriptional regulator